MITIPGMQLHLPFPPGSPNYNTTGYDSTHNHFFTANKTTIDETVFRYGEGSCRFNSDMWLSAKNSPLLNFGTGDFTIGFWMYCDIAWSSMGGSPGIIGQKGGDGSNGFQIYRNTSANPTKISMRVNGTTDIWTNATPAQGVWEHWEFSRSSGTLRIFKDGTLDSTHLNFTHNISDTTAQLEIGRSQTWGGPFQGRLDDIFVSNQAVHTANFTPDEISWSGVVSPPSARALKRLSKRISWPGINIGFHRVRSARKVVFLSNDAAIVRPREKAHPVKVRYEPFNYGGLDSRYPLLQTNTNGNLRGVVLQNTVPVALCRVGLYDRYTMALVAGALTNSDGTFRFNNQIVGYDGYFLIAFDQDGAPMQNAVILDKLTAT